MEKNLFLTLSYISNSQNFTISKKEVYNFYKFLISNNIKLVEALKNDLVKDNFKNIIDILEDKNNLSRFDRIIKNNLLAIEKNNINIITINDEKYPPQFKKLVDAPLIFFVKGKFPNNNELEKSFSIIGSREISKNIEDFCFDIGRYIEKQKRYNISGLALGSDTLGHKATLKATGAVLAYGLAREIYPQENKNLASDILKNNGFLMSEYLPLVTAKPKQFIERNRLITALATYVVIADIKEKSGTAHAFNFAKNQKKEIFVNEESKDFIEKNKNYLHSIKNSIELDEKIKNLCKNEQKSLFILE